MMENSEVRLYDFEPNVNSLLKEVLVGLSKTQKAIPPKLLYDRRGSEIFEDICKLPEYYPTRTETEILKTYAHEMAELIGPDALIIEPGSGSGEKVRHLLRELTSPKGYVPIEISKDILLRMAEELHAEFEHLTVLPVCADFTQEIELPLTVDAQVGKKVVFFPGSTIGNLDPSEALAFMKKTGKLIGSGGGVLIGVDLKKDAETFKLAYDDPQGVTAQFNLNLLERLNREASAAFNLQNFEHTAFYNEELGRVEMHLVSSVPQLVRVNQTVFRFMEGETIHTESSYKYTIEEFCELAAKARFKIKNCWQDEKKLFCVYYFEKE
ncbi:MAG TPA: L-histidine N(alpha)-methyltransferase [Bacteriovoracaceae bacterium]|nr:L-histidine N(alpha)-methyltransferase [Bacteriovoracaceae bacterium]